MMDRNQVFDTARATVSGPRQSDYGNAEQGFAATGMIWEAILGIPVTPEEVALCMIGLKLSRLRMTPNHEDSWVDLAGYAALGGEIASDRAARSTPVVPPEEPEE